MVYYVTRIVSALRQRGGNKRSEATNLGGDDHLVTDATRLHPLADELLGRLVLVVVRGVDEVAASRVERIEELEARLLVHRAHAELVPLVTDAHRPETQG